jgi:cell division septation protein DedD
VVVRPEDVNVKDLVINMDTSKRYHVIVGAFQNLNYATDLVAQLQSTLWKQTMIIGKRGDLSLVGVGSFDSKEEAERILDRARQEIILTAWIYDLEKEYDEIPK